MALNSQQTKAVIDKWISDNNLKVNEVDVELLMQDLFPAEYKRPTQLPFTQQEIFNAFFGTHGKGKTNE